MTLTILRNGLIFSTLLSLTLIHGYTGRDDSHITYFVADQLSSKNIFVNYNYSNLEQSSTLFFTVILAVIGKITGLHSAQFAPIVSSLFLFVTALTVQASRTRFSLHGLTGLATLALPILYWAGSGMENSLYAFLILLFVFYVSHLLCEYVPPKGRRVIYPFQTIGLLGTLSIVMLTCIISATRPEAPLVLLSTASILIIFYRGSPAVLKLALFIVLGICLLFIIRLGLGFEMFPNTVSAKQGRLDVLDRILKGTLYIIALFRDAPFSTAMILLSIGYVTLNNNINDKPFRDFALVGSSVSFSIMLFAFFSGGDWMELGRFVTVAFLLSIIIAVNLVSWRFGTKGVLVVSAMLLLEHFTFIVYSDYRTGSSVPLIEIDAGFSFPDIEAHNTVHARDLSFLSKMIPEMLDVETSNVSIAANQAGMVPYYLRQHGLTDFTFIDLIGLTTDIGSTCRSRWQEIWPAWQHIRDWEHCLGRKINYFYDVDNEALTRLNALERQGCTRVFLDRTRVKPFLKLKPYVYHQFLVRC